MQFTHNQNYLTAIADSIISGRFERQLGIITHIEYLDLIDIVSTNHLEPRQVPRVLRTAGRQRRRAQFALDSDTLIINVPVNDQRNGRELHAQLEYGVWLDLMEMGVNGAWSYVYKGREKTKGQLRVKLPFEGAGGPSHASLTRIIVNAKPGQRARVADGNPMNLRRSNVYLTGLSLASGGNVDASKTHTQQQVRSAVSLRDKIAQSRRG